MATFPQLKSGAVAQYPFEVSQRFATDGVRFLDGSRQRFKLYAGPLRKWTIRLELLDDQEIATLQGFLEQQGSSTFSFTDPVNGSTAATCIIDGGEWQVDVQEELRSATKVVIREVR